MHGNTPASNCFASDGSEMNKSFCRPQGLLMGTACHGSVGTRYLPPLSKLTVTPIVTIETLILLDELELFIEIHISFDGIPLKVSISRCLSEV